MAVVNRKLCKDEYIAIVMLMGDEWEYNENYHVIYRYTDRFSKHDPFGKKYKKVFIDPDTLEVMPAENWNDKLLSDRWLYNPKVEVVTHK